LLVSLVTSEFSVKFGLPLLALIIVQIVIKFLVLWLFRGYGVFAFKVLFKMILGPQKIVIAHIWLLFSQFFNFFLANPERGLDLLIVI
jgi:hypothetical protein